MKKYTITATLLLALLSPANSDASNLKSGKGIGDTGFYFGTDNVCRGTKKNESSLKINLTVQELTAMYKGLVNKSEDKEKNLACLKGLENGYMRGLFGNKDLVNEYTVEIMSKSTGINGMDFYFQEKALKENQRAFTGKIKIRDYKRSDNGYNSSTREEQVKGVITVPTGGKVGINANK